MPSSVPSKVARHRPRVGDVVAEVGAVVDAGDDQVGGPVLEQVEHPEVDAVGGGAVDAVAVLPQLLEAERTVEGERVAAGALLAVGGDHHHLPHRRQRLGEKPDPLGEDAVVVGDQDPGHRRKYLPTSGARRSRVAAGTAAGSVSSA